MTELHLIEAGRQFSSKKAPRRSRAERDTIKNARLAMRADARVDADLSRAIDAIAFLAQNEVDAAPLLARISPMETDAISANLKKAVEWLNRFADGWYVFIGNGKAEIASPGSSYQTRRGCLSLVRSRD